MNLGDTPRNVSVRQQLWLLGKALHGAHGYLYDGYEGRSQIVAVESAIAYLLKPGNHFKGHAGIKKEIAHLTRQAARIAHEIARIDNLKSIDTRRRYYDIIEAIEALDEAVQLAPVQARRRREEAK